MYNYKGEYNDSEKYKHLDAIDYGGAVYVFDGVECVGETPGANRGWVLLHPTTTSRGVYSAGTTYKTGDIVTYASLQYLKIKPLNSFTMDMSTGVVPTDTSKWILYASRQAAQLATDAGGVVGLSGGSPASGIPFGPPSTIFRLRMRCSGGAAVVTVVATKRSGGSDTFTFSLASGGDVSEPMYADDYSSLVWTKTGAGSVTVEVI